MTGNNHQKPSNSPLTMPLPFNDALELAINEEQLQKIAAIQPIVNNALSPIGSGQTSACCDESAKNNTSSCCGPAATNETTPDPNTAAGAPCCGPRVLPPQQYIPVALKKQNGIAYIDATLRFEDRLGAFKARLGKWRMSYAIAPGLYALGSPDRTSDVLVTANYKLSFDHLRSQLCGRNVWILVLNTYGINVWCAAGKGTFGTQELIQRIKDTELASVVDTRRIIVPQLGAPGVAAHVVKAQTGFRVVWGPVEASDVGNFIDKKYKATPKMREKKFPFKERLVLVPIEMGPALKTLLYLLAGTVPLAALAYSGAYLKGLVHYAILLGIYLTTGILSGAALTPLLLPYLPGRAFSLKSVWTSVALLVPLGMLLHTQIELFELIGLSLVAAAIAAYAAMNFTGASTYTSLSGVKKEMRFAVPTQITTAALGVTVWIFAQIDL